MRYWALYSPESDGPSAVAEGEPSYEEIVGLADEPDSDGAEGPSSSDSGTGAEGPETEGEGKRETVEGREGAPGSEEKAEGDEEKSDSPSDVLAEPEGLKEVWKHPKFGKELRKRYYTYEEHENLYGLEEAKELKELVPDVEAAKQLVDNAKTLQAFEKGIYSPEKGAEVVENLIKELPREAFSKLVRNFPDLQYQLDKQSYVEDTADRVKRAMLSVASRVNRETDQEKRTENLRALDRAAQLIFQKGLQDLRVGESVGYEEEDDPRDRRIQELEQQLTEREQGKRVEKFDNFSSYANDKSVEAVVEVLEDHFKRVLPSGTPEKVRARMVGDAYDKVEALMQADAAYKEALKGMLLDGDQSDQHAERIVRLTRQKARRVSTQVVRETLEDSKDLYNLSGGLSEGVDRVEISGAGGPASPGRREGSREQKGFVDPYEDVYDRALAD